MKISKQELKEMVERQIKRLEEEVDLKRNYYRLEESSFAKVMTSYFNSGFIIITANRTCEAEKGSECSQEEIKRQKEINKENENRLKRDIRDAHFGYIPMFGGYKETIKDPETGEEKYVDTETPERSFIIPVTKGYTYKYGGEEEVEKLKQLGIQLAKKYKQESFLFKPPNKVDKNAYYVDENGKEVMTFKSGASIGDMIAPYYTQMKKGRVSKRFTLKEEREMITFYIRKSANSTAEARKRYGEFFIRLKQTD